jgi:hypothetical protein
MQQTNKFALTLLRHYSTNYSESSPRQRVFSNCTSMTPLANIVVFFVEHLPENGRNM